MILAYQETISSNSGQQSANSNQLTAVSYQQSAIRRQFSAIFALSAVNTFPHACLPILPVGADRRVCPLRRMCPLSPRRIKPPNMIYRVSRRSREFIHWLTAEHAEYAEVYLDF